MEKVNKANQGMLKMLQDIHYLLKDGKHIKAVEIREKVGLELKYWVKLTNKNLIINIGKTCQKPVYKWDTIAPNLHMAIEVLKDIPKPLSERISLKEPIIRGDNFRIIYSKGFKTLHFFAEKTDEPKDTDGWVVLSKYQLFSESECQKFISKMNNKYPGLNGSIVAGIKYDPKLFVNESYFVVEIGAFVSRVPDAMIEEMWEFDRIEKEKQIEYLKQKAVRNEENEKWRKSTEKEKEKSNSLGMAHLVYKTDAEKEIENKHLLKNIQAVEGIKEKTQKTIPPTIEQVKEYCIERKSSVNPAQFMAYYESNGWRVGKDKMKDWKASVRYWETKNNIAYVSKSKTIDQYTNEELIAEIKKRGGSGEINFNQKLKF